MRRLCFAWFLAALACSSSLAQPRRKIIIDQDSQGPAGSNIQTLALLIQSPKTEVLGITVVTGNQWRDDEVARALRLLEIMGRTDIPVVPGAVFPLVRTQAEAALWQDRYGKVAFAGAWDPRWYHEPFVVPQFAEGSPTTKPSTEDAAQFLLRLVHKYPHEVTIYEGGPMTNLAQAISIDPQFPELAQELVFMGGSLSPQTDNPEFANNPRHEFNFWMDPEASHAVLHAHWPRVALTTVDISVKTRMEKNLIAEVAKSPTPAAQYVAKYAEANYLWDELAAVAWLDPSFITKWQKLYIDVDLDHGASYGETLAWAPGQQPGMGEILVDVQKDLDKEKFYKEYVELLTRPTPLAHVAAAKKD
jgi:purine nucleosidase